MAKKQAQKSWTPHEKQAAIQRVHNGEKKVAVAKSIGTSTQSLHKWMQAAEGPAKKRAAPRKQAQTPAPRINSRGTDAHNLSLRWDRLANYLLNERMRAGLGISDMLAAHYGTLRADSGLGSPNIQEDAAEEIPVIEESAAPVQPSIYNGANLVA